MIPAGNGREILDLVPGDWLRRYLALSAGQTGMHIRLMDPTGGSILAEAPQRQGDGGSGDLHHSSAEVPEPDGPWHAMQEAMGDEACQRVVEGVRVMVFPLHCRGERLGYLIACGTDAGAEAGKERIEGILRITASQLEGLAESGYETESMSGEIVRLYEELALVYSLTERLGTKTELREICRVVVEEAENVLDFSNIFIQLVDEKKWALCTVFASGTHRAEALAFESGIDGSILGWALANRHCSIISLAEHEVSEFTLPFPARNILLVPLVAGNKCLGIIIACDRRDGGEAFTSREQKLFSAISSVAAMAINGALLFSDIRELFDGFISASVSAVEARDPTTAGHSERVALLTVELAKKVDASQLPIFRNINFTPEQILEMRYAALLHDFGKIGVRESVLLKETKLSSEQMQMIRDRFDYIRERKTRESVERKLQILLDRGKEGYLQPAVAEDEKLAAEITQLEEIWGFLQVINDPRVVVTELPELEKISCLADKLYSDPRGSCNHYLTPFEFSNLKTLRGSLSDDERREIELHVTHSFNFLSKIPWTGTFPQITEIVHTHHEKLDGSGYPGKLHDDEIPIQAKIMAVADIFDALTASDRPYKKAVSVQKAIFILETEAKQGKLEPHLVQIFRDDEVHSVLGLRRK